MKNEKSNGRWSPTLQSFGDGAQWQLTASATADCYLFFFCLLTFFIAVLGCGREERKEAKGVVDATQVVEGFKLTETEFGKKSWVLTAHKALEFKDSMEVYGVQIVFFNPDGNRNSTLTSDRGIVSQETKDMIAIGNVIVQAEDGTRLETDQLKWVQDREKILTDSFVRITKGESLVTGKGMESNPDLSHMEIREEFQATEINEE